MTFLWGMRVDDSGQWGVNGLQSVQEPSLGSGLRAAYLCPSLSPCFLRSLFLGGAVLPSLPVSLRVWRESPVSSCRGHLPFTYGKSRRGGGGGGVRKQNTTVFSESSSLSNNWRRKQSNSSPFFSFGHLSLFLNRVNSPLPLESWSTRRWKNLNSSSLCKTLLTSQIVLTLKKIRKHRGKLPPKKVEIIPSPLNDCFSYFVYILPRCFLSVNVYTRTQQIMHCSLFSYELLTPSVQNHQGPL